MQTSPALEQTHPPAVEQTHPLTTEPTHHLTSEPRLRLVQRPPHVRSPDGNAVHWPKVSVVVPTKNEAANVPWVLERIPSWVHEVIVVDGRSTDGTPEAARRARPDVLVVHEGRPGKGAAIRAGFEAASGDVIVMIDADGSMDPSEIGRFVRSILDGADLAKGSRRMPGGGSADITAVRDLGNRGLLLGANILFNQRFSELCYGFMALRAEHLDTLALRSDGFEIETEIVVRAVRTGLRVAEVPSFEAPRRTGASNLNSVRDGLRIVRTLMSVRVRPAEVGVTAGRRVRA